MRIKKTLSFLIAIMLIVNTSKFTTTASDIFGITSNLDGQEIIITVSDNQSDEVSTDLISNNQLEDTISDNNSVSFNTGISENIVSENVISENAVSENTISENAVSDNSASSNTISEDSISENELRFVYQEKTVLSNDVNITLKGEIPEGYDYKVVFLESSTISENQIEKETAVKKVNRYDISIVDKTDESKTYEPSDYNKEIRIIFEPANTEMNEITGIVHNKDNGETEEFERKDITVTDFSEYRVYMTSYGEEGKIFYSTNNGMSWIKIENMPVSWSALKPTNVDFSFWDKSSTLTSTRNLFKNCYYLTEVIFGENFDASNITDESGMFMQCWSLEYIDFSSLSSPVLEDISYICYGCNSLKTADMTSFYARALTDISFAFTDCNALTTVCFGTSFNAPNVTTAQSLFDECWVLTDVDIQNLKIPNVQILKSAFKDCHEIVSLDLTNFSALKVENTSWMLANCYKLTQVSFGSGWSTTTLNNMSYMCYSCTSLNKIDFSCFYTQYVVHMEYLIAKCSSLENIILGNGWNTENVNNLSGFAEECKAFTAIEFNRFNTAKVQNLSNAFLDCTSLVSLDMSNCDITSLISKSGALEGLEGLQQIKLNRQNYALLREELSEEQKQFRNSSFVSIAGADDSNDFTEYFAEGAKLTFESNGGSAVSPVYIRYDNITQAPLTPVRHGYDFKDWYKDASLRNIFLFGTPLFNDTTIYAGWTDAEGFKDGEETTSKLTFAVKGGSEIAAQDVKYWSCPEKPADPTREHSTFGGWFKESDYKTDFDFSEQMKGRTITAYAKWNNETGFEAGKEIESNLRFETFGGTEIAGCSVKYWSEPKRPEQDPEKQYYVFDGWYADQECTEEFPFDSIMKGLNRTAYAKWVDAEGYIDGEEIKSIMSYETYGGTSFGDIKVKYWNTPMNPGIPKKTGYTFEGWYDSSKLEKKFNFDEQMKGIDKTAYAKWVEKESTQSSSSTKKNSQKNVTEKTEETLSIAASGKSNSSSITTLSDNENIITTELLLPAKTKQVVEDIIESEYKKGLTSISNNENISGNDIDNIQDQVPKENKIKDDDQIEKGHITGESTVNGSGISSNENGFGLFIQAEETLVNIWWIFVLLGIFLFVFIKKTRRK